MRTCVDRNMTETYEKGDLLATIEEVVIRKDGWTFTERDAEDGKVPTDWLKGGDVLAAGEYCTFIRPGDEDPGYALVLKGIAGRPMFIRLESLKLIRSINEDDQEVIENR